MNEDSVGSALQFVKELQLPALARGGYESLESTTRVDFDELKDQATVVGSEVISFVKGVSVERRQDIVNCALLAQLAADHKVPDRANVFAWYDVYFDVLAHLGWVVQDKGFAAYDEQAEGLEAHEAILKVAAGLPGTSPTALALLTSTIGAMKELEADNPWLTIFDRESCSAQSARFQVALASVEEDGQFLVTMMAFAIKANASLTQVLFFKFRKDRVKIKQCSGKVTINDTVLNSVRETVRTKLIGRTHGYVDSLDLG